MTSTQATLVGLGTFVVGLALCATLFVILEVEMVFLLGPGLGVGAAAYSAYRSALDGGAG